MAGMVVQLSRSHGQPWGFRLQGGRDYGSQLAVKKVQAGTPSAGALYPGDAIMTIGNMNTQNLTHMQAHELIKSSGNYLQLTLVRGQSADFSAIRPSGPLKFTPRRM